MNGSSFSVYNMSINYPREWKVELKHNSSFGDGGFGVLEPNGRAIITVLWRSKGQLTEIVREEVKGGFLGFFSKPALKEADLKGMSLLDIHRELVWYKLRGGAKNVKLLSSGKVEVNGHKAYLELVIFKPTIRFLLVKRMGGTIRRIQLLLICDETGRAFALFGSALDPDFSEFEEILKETILSFRCHT